MRGMHSVQSVVATLRALRSASLGRLALPLAVSCRCTARTALCSDQQQVAVSTHSSDNLWFPTEHVSMCSSAVLLHRSAFWQGQKTTLSLEYTLVLVQACTPSWHRCL